MRCGDFIPRPFLSLFFFSFSFAIWAGQGGLSASSVSAPASTGFYSHLHFPFLSFFFFCLSPFSNLTSGHIMNPIHASRYLKLTMNT